MRFIRLSTLKTQFPEYRFPLTGTEAETFRSVFYASNIASNQSIPETEQWLLSLQSEEFVLFLDWTEQERNLTAVLEGTDTIRPFQNSTRMTQHAMFERYRRFVTPFLQPRLNETLTACKPEIWQDALTYLTLLTERESELTQQIVYDRMRKQHALAEQLIRKAKTEDELLHIVRSNLKPDFIAALNLLTSVFYQAKTAWIQLLRLVAEHPAGTRRLVLYMSKELQQLHLNPDHLKELQKLDKSVKSGEVKVESSTWPLKRIIYLSLGLAALVALIIFIWLIPTKPTQEMPQEKTAFMDFSVEERKTIDSLLQDLKMQRERLDDNALDHSDMTYVGEELIVNIPWKNQAAEQLINDWMERDTINRTPRTEDSKADNRSFPSTELLSDKKGTITAKFQNDTPLSVMIMVFRDREDEWVYTQYVEKNGVISFKLNPEDNLFVLPGSKVPNHLNAGGLPFEQLDSRFFENLETAYVVDDNSPHKIKLIWKALNSYDFYLIDLNSALNKQ